MEEQLADETYEQFEERVLNKRAAAMYHLVRAKLQMSSQIPFSEMAVRNNKKQVNQRHCLTHGLILNSLLDSQQECIGILRNLVYFIFDWVSLKTY